MTPTLTVHLPTSGELAAEPSTVLDLVRLCDDLGVTTVALNEHVAMGRDVSDLPVGSVPPRPGRGRYVGEPTAMIAAMAAVTGRVRFRTQAVVPALRPAPLFARGGGHDRSHLCRPCRAGRGSRLAPPRVRGERGGLRAPWRPAHRDDRGVPRTVDRAPGELRGQACPVHRVLSGAITRCRAPCPSCSPGR